MPGVPPDALNQVKKGFKGLFSRKKRDKFQPEPESSVGSSSAAQANQGAAVAAYHVDTASVPQHGSSTIPQISVPANVEESKNIDLNPSSPNNLRASTAEQTEAFNPIASDLSLAQSALPKLEAKVPAEGMSATSGPLFDDPGYGASLGSPAEEKKLELPEKERGSQSMGETEDTGVRGIADQVETVERADHAEGYGVIKAFPEESHE